MINSTQAQRVWIDNVGKGHLRPEVVNMRNYRISRAALWGERWAGTKHTTFINNVKWRMKGDEEDRHLHEFTTKIMTRAKTMLKFKPPNSEAA